MLAQDPGAPCGAVLPCPEPNSTKPIAEAKACIWSKARHYRVEQTANTNDKAAAALISLRWTPCSPPTSAVMAAELAIAADSGRGRHPPTIPG